MSSVCMESYCWLFIALWVTIKAISVPVHSVVYFLSCLANVGVFTAMWTTRTLKEVDCILGFAGSLFVSVHWYTVNLDLVVWSEHHWTSKTPAVTACLVTLFLYVLLVSRLTRNFSCIQTYLSIGIGGTTNRTVFSTCNQRANWCRLLVLWEVFWVDPNIR